MTIPPRIILASGSAIRAKILHATGIVFEVEKPGVDESSIKRSAKKEELDPEKTAMRLAEAKCSAVASVRDGIVIGSDQILEFEGRLYDKPQTMGEARKRFVEMQNASHTLINAIAVARDGDIIWRHVDRPKLFLRALSEKEIDDYLSAAGPEILHSVGAYQIENLGSRLFDHIEGDHNAVLGLSLFPLLTLLRREKAIAF